MGNKKFIAAAFDYRFRLQSKYRSDLLFSFFSELALPLAINILFMIGLTGASASPQQIVNLVAYLVVANITYTISVTDLENTIASDIKSAKLIYKLLEPVSPCANYILSDLADKVFRILLFYVPCLLILGIFGQLQFSGLLYGIPFILIANVIGYCLSFLIGCLSFWVTEIWGISAVKKLLLSVFAGTIFPFSYLSDKAQFLLFLTPFPYLSYIPSALILGEMGSDDLLFLLGVGTIWCVIFAFSAKIVWSLGKKKYESVGV